MSEAKMDKARRNLIIATSAVGGAASLGVAVPFVWSMWPSERAKAAGGPVEADISALAPGELMIVEWRSKPVWVMRRTKEMLEDLKKVDGKVTDPTSSVPEQPDYAKNEYRSIKPEVLVLVGICTHLGCSPKPKSAEDKAEMGAEWGGGFYCPCHGSKFDLAGRVYKGSPAPKNLEVPKYTFLSDTKILIGEDKQSKGA
ncbi:MAG TPA: ubiquinol-cytochrome c reductase iron-sulfur subunit [Burkholderiales bacterium]|jgi:ubiquinol-cytochrome c reductase iron-sulfur subunit|nr:ubiquinol-cytochrome c reductase iron-sulfur subunit [Burkholderiales bacterium]